MFPASARKTELVLKPTRSIVIILVLLVLFAAGVAIITRQSSDKKKDSANTCSGVLAKDKCFDLERTESPEARMKGLSNRETLPENSAMLFEFEGNMQQCMWMKDMRFSLDIVWLNRNMEVIKIEPYVSPATFPRSFCGENTKYVLEFNAGTTQALQLKVGDHVQL